MLYFVKQAQLRDIIDFLRMNLWKRNQPFRFQSKMQIIHPILLGIIFAHSFFHPKGKIVSVLAEQYMNQLMADGRIKGFCIVWLEIRFIIHKEQRPAVNKGADIWRNMKFFLKVSVFVWCEKKNIQWLTDSQ